MHSYPLPVMMRRPTAETVNIASLLLCIAITVFAFGSVKGMFIGSITYQKNGNGERKRVRVSDIERGRKTERVSADSIVPSSRRPFESNLKTVLDRL